MEHLLTIKMGTRDKLMRRNSPKCDSDFGPLFLNTYQEQQTYFYKNMSR